MGRGFVVLSRRSAAAFALLHISKVLVPPSQLEQPSEAAHQGILSVDYSSEEIKKTIPSRDELPSYAGTWNPYKTTILAGFMMILALWCNHGMKSSTFGSLVPH